MDLTLLLLFVFIGAVNGILTSLTGGGGLISIPFLIFAGLPSNIAVATNSFSALGSALGSIPAFFKGNKIEKRIAIPLMLISITGAIIGATLLVKFPTNALSKTIGILLILLTIFFIFKDKIATRLKGHSKSEPIGYFLFFANAILAGFFLGGTGAIAILVLTLCFGLDVIKANATRMPALVILTLVTSFIFWQNNLINFEAGIASLIGTLIGGFLGAKLAILKGEKWVQPLFIIVVVLTALKLII